MLRTICSYYSLPLERLLNGASLHSEATLELNAKISRKRRGMNSRNIKPRRVLYLRFRKTISKRRERRRTLFFVLQQINFSLRILLFSSSMRIDDTSIDTRRINRGNPTFLSQNRDQFSIKVHTVWEKGELTSYRKKVAKICVYLAAFPKIARYMRDLSRENRETGRYVTHVFSLRCWPVSTGHSNYLALFWKREREGCYRICNYVSCQPRLVSLSS